MGDDEQDWLDTIAGLWAANAAGWSRSVRSWQILTAVNVGIAVTGVALVAYGAVGHPPEPAPAITGGLTVATMALFLLFWYIPPRRAHAHERYQAALRSETTARIRALPSRPDLPDDVF